MSNPNKAIPAFDFPDMPADTAPRKIQPAKKSDATAEGYTLVKPVPGTDHVDKPSASLANLTAAYETLKRIVETFDERLQAVETSLAAQSESMNTISQNQSELVETYEMIAEVLIDADLMERVDDGAETDSTISTMEDIISEDDDDDITDEYDDDDDGDEDDEIVLSSTDNIPEELARPAPFVQSSALESPDGPENEIRQFTNNVEDDIGESDIRDYVPSDYRHRQKDRDINRRQKRSQDNF